MRFIYLGIIGLLASCFTNDRDIPYGRVGEHSGFVPARTAVLECRFWYNPARFKNLPLSNISKPEAQTFCEDVDKFVLKGFKDQPFMRGFSPKGIRKLLQKDLDILDQKSTHWKHLESDCLNCKNAASFYINSIQERKPWRTWLKSFSEKIRHADAVLLPFVMYAVEKKVDDRGIQIMQREAELVLLLVDTEFGYLLWSGARRSVVTNQMKTGLDTLPEYPEWSRLRDRLFVEDIWHEFPGRQVIDGI